MDKNIKTYFKGVSSGYAKMLLMILIQLFMVPFTLKFLTRAEYGVFAIAGDILLWLGLLQLGTGASLNSRAAQLIGRRDTKHLSELASTAFILQVVAAGLMVVIGGFISQTVNSWFAVSEPIEGLSLVVFMLILGASIRITAQVFNGLLIANKQIHVDNLLGMGLFLFRTALTIVFLLLGMKLMALAWSALIATATVSLITYFRVKKQMPEVRIQSGLFRKEHVRDLLGNGVWFTIGGLAGILIVNLDRFMVGRFVSLEAVTFFIITGKLYYIADKLHQQVFNVMRPYFGQLHGQGRIDKLSDLYHAAFSGSLLLSVFMASVIYLLNGWFISWWVGPEFYLGNTISFLFALNFVLQSSVLPNRILLASTLFKMPHQNIARVSEGVLNLALTLIFVKIWGIPGVLLGSVVATVLCSAIFMNLIARSFFVEIKTNNQSLWTYLAIGSLIALSLQEQLGYASYWVAMVLLGIISFLSIKGWRKTSIFKRKLFGLKAQ